MTGKATSKLLNVSVNIPLLFLVSILPDFDLLIPGLTHRGATHSLIVSAIILLPAFMKYRWRSLPYVAALVQHSLLGDLLTGGGVQILWPIDFNWFGAHIPVISLTNIYAEVTIFLASMTIMLKTKDVQMFFRHHTHNMLLTVPVITIVLPTFFSFPLSVPLILVIPHLIYLTLLGISVSIDIKSIVKAS